VFADCSAAGALPDFMANSQFLLLPIFASTCPATGTLLETSANFVAIPEPQGLVCPTANFANPITYVLIPTKTFSQ
jgi:hypothetical protein